MLYIQKKKRKLLLFIGFLGMELFAVGDVLLQSFSNDGDPLLILMKTTVREMLIGRLYFTLLTGIIAAPSMYFGLCATDSYLRDRLGSQKGKMYRCFQIGAIIGVLSFIAAYSVCVVLMMSVRQTLICGIPTETVDTAYRTPFLISFAATNLWVTVTELCLSVAFIYFVLKRIIPLPKAAVLMNTVGFYTTRYCKS